MTIKNENLIKSLSEGEAIMLLEVRGARLDSFEFVSKKTGQKQKREVVRYGFETIESGEQIEGVSDGNEIPSWAVKGNKVFVSVRDIKRDFGRRSISLLKAVPS